MAKAVRESDIRMRVRQSLVSEARARFLASDQSTGSRAPEDPTNRSRGRADGKSETSGGAMARLQQQLMTAEVGDTFYLTFILSNMKGVSGQRAKTIDPTGRPVLQYTTDLYDLYRDMALGTNEFFSADDVMRSQTSAERNSKLLQSDISSQIAAGDKMVTRGLQTIAGIQNNRIQDLTTDMSEITAGTMTPANALMLLFGARRAPATAAGGTAQSTITNTPSAIDTRSKPIFMPPGNLPDITQKLSSEDTTPAERTRIINSIRSAVYGGRIPLSDRTAREERALVNAALIASVGAVLYRAGRPENGGIKVAGAGRAYVEKHERTSTLIQRVARMTPQRVADLFTGEVSGEGAGGPGQGFTEDARRTAAQILIGTCATDCNFPEARADINLQPGEALAMMEKAGVPCSILMHRVELLLSALEIRYRRDETTGVMAPIMTPGGGPLTRAMMLLSGAMPAGRAQGSAGAVIAWANHFDPEEAISLARSVRSARPVPQAAGHAAGSRFDSHYDERVSKMVSALRALPSGSSPSEIQSAMSSAVPDASREEQQTAMRFVRDMGSIRSTHRTPEGAASFLSLSSRREHESYNMARSYLSSGRNARQVVEEMRSLTMGQKAEDAIYKYLLEPLQYGVTMRCVGHSVAPQFSVKSLDAAEQGDGSQTLREFPVFDVKAEEPRQSAINKIQDPEVIQRLYMSANAFGKESKGVSYQSVAETGVAPDEGGGTKYARGPGSPRPDISCTMVSIPNFEEALNGDKTYSQEVSEALESGTIILDGDLTVPYIEKVTASYKQVGPDFIDTMERKLDGRLRPRNVTLQLMSAVKAKGEAGPIRVVSSAGIGRGFGPGGINAQVVEKFDVTGRTVLDPLSANPFREDVKDAIEKLRMMTFERPLLDQIPLTQAMLDFQSILNSSHNKSDDDFASLVNARAAARGLSSIRDELQRIASRQVRTREVTNLQQRNLPANLRRTARALADTAVSSDSPDTVSASAGYAMKIAELLDTQLSSDRKPGIKRASPVVIAALYTRPDGDEEDERPATSKADIIARGVSGSATTSALGGVIEIASEAAGKALLDLSSLQIDRLIRVAQRGTARSTEEIQIHGIEESAAATDFMESLRATSNEFTEVHDTMPEHLSLAAISSLIAREYRDIVGSIERNSDLDPADFTPLTTATADGLTALDSAVNLRGSTKESLIDLCVRANAARRGKKVTPSRAKAVREVAGKYYDLLIRVKDEMVGDYDIDQMIEDTSEILESTLGLYISMVSLIEDATRSLSVGERHDAKLREAKQEAERINRDLKALDELFNTLAVELRANLDDGDAAPVSNGIRCAIIISQELGPGGAGALAKFIDKAYEHYAGLSEIAREKLIPIVVGSTMGPMSRAANVPVPPDPMKNIRAREQQERVTEDTPSATAVIDDRMRDELSITPTQARIVKAFIKGQSVGDTSVVDLAALTTDPYGAAKRIIVNILSSTGGERRETADQNFASTLRNAMFPLVSSAGVRAALRLPDDPTAAATLNEMVDLETALKSMKDEIETALESLQRLLEIALNRRNPEEARKAQLAIIACGEVLGVSPTDTARTGGAPRTRPPTVGTGPSPSDVGARPAASSAPASGEEVYEIPVPPRASTRGFSRSVSRDTTPTAYRGVAPAEGPGGRQGVEDIATRATTLKDILSAHPELGKMTLEQLTVTSIDAQGDPYERLRSLLPLIADDYVTLSRKVAAYTLGRASGDAERRTAEAEAEGEAKGELPSLIASSVPGMIASMQRAISKVSGRAPPVEQAMPATPTPTPAPPPTPVEPKRASAGLARVRMMELLNNRDNLIKRSEDPGIARGVIEMLTSIIRDNGGEITDAEVEEMVEARGRKETVEKLFQKLAALAPKSV